MNVLINTSSGGSVALPAELVPDDHDRAVLLADCFARAIADAVDAEREACAEIADEALQFSLGPGGVASAIRARSAP